MLKRVLVCAALLTPVTAFAGAPDLPDDPGEDLCFDIGQDELACQQMPECFWDSSDVRCEWIIDPHPCARMSDPGDCNASPACFWDSSDVRCERLR